MFGLGYLGLSCGLEKAAFDNCIASVLKKQRETDPKRTIPIVQVQVPGTPYTSPPECSRLAEALYQCERRDAAQTWGMPLYPAEPCQTLWDAVVECRMRLPAEKQKECSDLQAKYTSCESAARSRTAAPGLPGGPMRTGDVPVEAVAAAVDERARVPDVPVVIEPAPARPKFSWGWFAAGLAAYFLLGR